MKNLTKILLLGVSCIILISALVGCKTNTGGENGNNTTSDTTINTSTPTQNKQKKPPLRNGVGDSAGSDNDLAEEMTDSKN